MVKGLTSQLFQYLGGWIYLGIFEPFIFCTENCFCMFFVLHTGTWVLLFFVSFFSIFFCCIISFIIYFISSCEIKAQELYSSLKKKGRMKCILNTLRNLLAKIEMHTTSLSPLFPSPSQVYQTPFHPKLLYAATSSLVWIPYSSLSFLCFMHSFEQL